MRLRLNFLVVVSTIAASLSAQSLIGGADIAGVPSIERLIPGCLSLPLCAPILGLPSTPWAGGTAYDPTRQVVWDTDGATLVGVEVRTFGGPCQITCAPMGVPGITPGSLATGLAFEEDNTTAGALWSLDSAGGLQRMTWASRRSCPTVGARCSIAAFLPTPNHRPGGLAVSEVHGLVFFSASDFSGGPPANQVFAAPLNNPCQVTCRLQIASCAALTFGPITGLAFDDCTSTLFISDGRTTLIETFMPAGGGLPCNVQSRGCCPPSPNRRYGLCVEPQHPTTVGASCMAFPCPLCPSMTLAAVGDPVLGNAGFGLRISDAPDNVVAACLLSAGPCTAGIPVLCGTLYLSLAPPPVSIGVAVTSGGACLGVAFHPLPVPLNPGLCGAALAVQDVIVCPGTPLGVGLTNAVCLSISDS